MTAAGRIARRCLLVAPACLTLMPLACRATDLPLYPVDANCREATGFLYAGSALPPERKRALVQDCIQVQQDAFAVVRQLWPLLQERDRASCRHLVQTDNYLLLRNCVSSLYAQERNAEDVGGGATQPAR